MRPCADWHFGEIASCHALMDEAISTAKELKDRYTLAMALVWAAALADELGIGNLPHLGNIIILEHVFSFPKPCRYSYLISYADLHGSRKRGTSANLLREIVSNAAAPIAGLSANACQQFRRVSRSNYCWSETLRRARPLGQARSVRGPGRIWCRDSIRRRIVSACPSAPIAPCVLSC